ncbi:hypothetical protein OG851_00300 [Streptomyces sp. NBC_00161]|uniref:hypothetical protein n=1 Tax=Streptomyces sp. NBC_00161 TaxID=2975671 RepID=UPI003250E795
MEAAETATVALQTARDQVIQAAGIVTADFASASRILGEVVPFFAVEGFRAGPARW